MAGSLPAMSTSADVPACPTFGGQEALSAASVDQLSNSYRAPSWKGTLMGGNGRRNPRQGSNGPDRLLGLGGNDKLNDKGGDDLVGRNTGNDVGNGGWV